MEEIVLLRNLVLAAQREGNRRLGEILRPLGVTPAQAEVLGVLARRQPLSLNALGERLICESGSPSRLAAGLVRAGILRRNEAAEDGRMILFSLTPRGEGLAARTAAAEAAYHGEMAAALAERSLSAANAALWGLVAGRPAGRSLKRRLGEGLLP